MVHFSTGGGACLEAPSDQSISGSSCSPSEAVEGFPLSPVGARGQVQEGAGSGGGRFGGGQV